MCYTPLRSLPNPIIGGFQMKLQFREGNGVLELALIAILVFLIAVAFHALILPGISAQQKDASTVLFYGVLLIVAAVLSALCFNVDWQRH